MTCVAPAVAFATGGATLSALTVYLTRDEPAGVCRPVIMDANGCSLFDNDRLINSIIIYFIEQQSGGIAWRD